MHVLQLIWDKPPIVPEEPLAPHTLARSLPVIVGSTFTTWDDFREWYAEAVRGFTEPDDQVRRLAAELTKGKKTREEKLRALFEFVADDIRYVNYVSGEWWLPNRPQQLLARRQGDCDDKAMLLITLLRSIGIEAQEVLVQTRYTGQPSVLLAKKAAIPLFDHGIAFLPGPNGRACSSTRRARRAASGRSRRWTRAPSRSAWTTAPPRSCSCPRARRTITASTSSWSITLAADGSGELTGEERHFGDAAF